MNLNKLCFLILLSFIFLACKQPSPKNQVEKSSRDTISSDLFHIPFASSGELNAPALVLVLHGDAPFNNPSYQYGIAKRIAEENENVLAVGVLRPGYEDNEGNRSPGERGEATGDNYTLEVLASIHRLTHQLKNKYNPSNIFLVGHSGGAAISANLLSQYPATYAHAVLISCPCDLHQWRAHMKQLQADAPIWDQEISSLSPIEGIEKIDASTHLAIIHGAQDKIVPIAIAAKYVGKLEEHGKKADYILLENQGHEVAFNDKVFDTVQKLLK